MRMQNLVCLMAVRFAKVLIIDLLDFGILMTLAELHSCILAVQCRRALFAQIDKVPDIAGLDRLTAAVDASAGACHNFHELIRLLAALDHVKELGSIFKTAGDRNADFGQFLTWDFSRDAVAGKGFILR